MDDVLADLEARGLIQDHTDRAALAARLAAGPITLYAGFDPTASSLHVGNLVPLLTLRRFQDHGHRPLVLAGGATGMIGDPGGRTSERSLQDDATVRANVEAITGQLMALLDFDAGDRAAVLVDNADWTAPMGVLDFLRDVGKYVTVNQMLAKESIRARVDSDQGISFTEFSYMLLQANDYHWLHQHHGCELQVGGSDQWGNIITGTELIRRKEGGEAFALTCPLITKADGGKFGKTESGNVWLDPKLTTPYKFYQFWLNVSDADAEKYIKIFTLLSQEEVTALVKEKEAAQHLRPLQKRLAKEVTCMVHNEEEFNKAVEASEILFGKATTESLAKLDKETFLSVFEGVPTYEVDRNKFDAGVPVVELLATETATFPSKGELRCTIKGNGLSLNKAKLTDQEYLVTEADLINGSYILVQKGKKNYTIIEAV